VCLLHTPVASESSRWNIRRKSTLKGEWMELVGRLSVSMRSWLFKVISLPNKRIKRRRNSFFLLPLATFDARHPGELLWSVQEPQTTAGNTRNLFFSLRPIQWLIYGPFVRRRTFWPLSAGDSFLVLLRRICSRVFIFRHYKWNKKGKK